MTLAAVITVSKTHKIRFYAYPSAKAVIRETLTIDGEKVRYDFKPRRKRGQSQADAADIIAAHFKPAMATQEGVSYLKPILDNLSQPARQAAAAEVIE